MRQLLKITSIFALALVFSAGMAFGQVDNESDVEQEGDDNTSTVEQVGENQGAYVYQKSPEDLDDGHTATVTQNGIGGGSGLNNDAVVDQTTSPDFPAKHTTTINQAGDGNQAGAKQGGAISGGSDGDNATITQTGDGNYSAVHQSSGVTFTSTQDGNNNIVAGFAPGFDQLDAPEGARGPARQETGASFGGPLGVMDFEQIGDNNRIAGAEQSPGRSIAEVTQQGDGNEVSILDQDGPGNVVRLDQYDGSEAQITQFGANNELAGANSDGEFVSGSVAEQEGGAVLNYAEGKEALQEGNSNELGLYQNGGTANISQLGGNNDAVLYQDGNSTANILQTGNDDLSSVIQDGTGNTATVSQSPGN